MVRAHPTVPPHPTIPFRARRLAWHRREASAGPALADPWRKGILYGPFTITPQYDLIVISR